MDGYGICWQVLMEDMGKPTKKKKHVQCLEKKNKKSSHMYQILCSANSRLFLKYPLKH